MSYIIVASTTPEELIKFVSDRLRDGYKPLGGVSACMWPSGSGFQFFQAMFKEQEA